MLCYLGILLFYADIILANFYPYSHSVCRRVAVNKGDWNKLEAVDG